MKDEIMELGSSEEKQNDKTKTALKKSKETKDKIYEIKELTPSQIVEELDKFIIGQDNAKNR
jgi:ATP-dependent protease Clp ATPase subunit